MKQAIVRTYSQIQRIVRDQAEHHAIHKHAKAAKHALQIHRQHTRLHVNYMGSKRFLPLPVAIAVTLNLALAQISVSSGKCYDYQPS
tara:strand:+ start:1126 stop:1386 length:261 start_codon:yes stop_codon:yes gene_type:complete